MDVKEFGKMLEWVKASRPKPPPLGDPPWTVEVIQSRAMLDLEGTTAAVNTLPGRELQERIESLSAVLQMFDRVTAEFLAHALHYADEMAGGNIFERRRRREAAELERAFREGLFSVVATAGALVDQSRGLKDYPVAGYEDEVGRAFKDSPAHRFLIELRNDLLHSTMHSFVRRITDSASGRAAQILLMPEQLTRALKYNALARRYLAEHPKGVDVVALVAAYRTTVHSFHSWWADAITRTYETEITLYTLSARALRAVGQRVSWRLLLGSVVDRGRDAEEYLTSELTDDELAQIEGLPLRSRERVDRIIYMVDLDGACDDELRTLAYKAFRVE